MLKNATGFHGLFVSSQGCSNAAPTPYWHASASTLNGFLKSGNWSTSSDDSICFNLQNACSQSSFQTNFVVRRVAQINGEAILAKSRIYFL